MKRKTRLILLITCAVLFFAITPYIVFYSLGYRINFEKGQIVAIGGIYIKADPVGTDVIIDSTIKNTTGYFYNSVFVQNLLPTTHQVLITKDGYFDYQKNLTVKENEVTKLEHITLFKKTTAFDQLDSSVTYITLSPDGSTIFAQKIIGQVVSFETINTTTLQKQPILLPTTIGLTAKNATITDSTWAEGSQKILLLTQNSTLLVNLTTPTPGITSPFYLQKAKDIHFNPQNSEQLLYVIGKNLYSNTQELPLLKNVLAYQITNNTLTWLADDGFLYSSSLSVLSTTIPQKITLKALALGKNSTYTITISSGYTWLKKDDTLFILNPSSHIFDNFYNPVKEVKMSPDNQKILYYDDHQIALSNFLVPEDEKVVVYNSSSTINDVYWLNNDYILFTTGDTIMISEIDVRDHVNTVTLNPFMPFKMPNVLFSPVDQRVYVLSENMVLVSKKLTP